MYMSENFARIQCSECGKIVDTILPGPRGVFKGIKPCECQKKTPIKRYRAKKEEDKKDEL